MSDMTFYPVTEKARALVVNGGCPPDCGHTQAEHAAFDRGLAAGESGAGFRDNPYRRGNLIEAWLTGYSVGVMNRNAEGSR